MLYKVGLNLSLWLEICKPLLSLLINYTADANTVYLCHNGIYDIHTCIERFNRSKEKEYPNVLTVGFAIHSA